MNSILISGSSTEDYGDFSPEEANKFISLLTQKLLENKYKVVNGFGLGVGHAVVNGALDYSVFCKTFLHNIAKKKYTPLRLKFFSDYCGFDRAFLSR